MSSHASKEGHFVRAIGLFDATSLVVGSMIGSGIFIVSADIAREVGAPGWMLAVWALTLVITVVACLSYGELAGMFPGAGGQYVYLREAFGPLPGFLYGWTLFLIIQSGSIAAVGVAFAKFLGVLVPEVSSDNVLLQIHDGSWFGKISMDQVVGIAVVALLTAINCMGVRAGKAIQNIFTVLKMLALLAVIGLALFATTAPNAALRSPDFWNPIVKGQPLDTIGLVSAIGVAMVGSLFAADAWNNITFVGGEVKDPKRTIAISMAVGGGLVCVLYFIVNVAYLKVLPFDGIQNAANDRVGTAAMQAVLGPQGELFMAAAIMISTFGAVNGMVLQGPRLYYAMAIDGLFFSRAGHLGGKSNVPVWGTVAQGVWSAALCLTGKYGDLLDYVIFAALLFYAASVLGIFVLRRKRPELPRPYKAWGYPFVPALYVLLCVGIMVVLLIQKPLYTWPGLAIVLSGIPVYFLWRKLGTRQPTAESP
jgi:APA family basic amino acid/polyamine antiporter